AKARGNTLSLAHLGVPVRQVIGDEVRVRQILFNLIGNAIKFTENGSVTVEVETSAESDHVEFRVIDSGIGISESNLDRIFEDFVTLDASFQREVEGTGLGLGIVKRLVTMLGGEIGVESEQGNGSVFWFNLPLPKVTTHVTSSPVDIGLESAQDQFAAKVLVVEDNEINRMVVGEMLQLHGCEVTEAQDGHEGVLFAQNVAFDLILMDISMPKIDGVTAAKTVKAESGPNQNTPIIALTAHAMPDDVQKFHAAGMIDVITKPISAERLQEVLGDVLNATSTHNVSTQMDELIDAFGAKKAKELEQQAKHQLIEGFADLERLLSTQAPREDVSALAHKLAGTAAIFGVEPALTELRSIELADPSISDAELINRLNKGKPDFKII
ncbi:unnamed protein product, partial [Ectocarpus sp. 12 AP-2014]